MSVVLEQPRDLAKPEMPLDPEWDREAKRLRRLSAAKRIAQLTTAEREVVEAMANGLSPKEVAVARGTSLATVRTQIKRAKKKTASRTIMELVALACQAEAQKS